jgi:beta-mannosidase
MYNGECHMNLLRKMQASFAWDWGLAAPSMGIWKEALVDVYDSVVIRDIVYKLIDGREGEDDIEVEEETVDDDVWTLKVSVHMETGLKAAEFQGVISCELM